MTTTFRPIGRYDAAVALAHASHVTTWTIQGDIARAVPDYARVSEGALRWAPQQDPHAWRARWAALVAADPRVGESPYPGALIPPPGAVAQAEALIHEGLLDPQARWAFMSALVADDGPLLWGPGTAPGCPCSVLAGGTAHPGPSRPEVPAETYGGRALRVLRDGTLLAEVPAHRPSGIEPQGEGQSWSPFEVAVRLGLAAGVLIGLRWVEEVGEVIAMDHLPANIEELRASDRAAHAAWLAGGPGQPPPKSTAPWHLGGALTGYRARPATPTECRAAAAAAARDTTLAGQAARWGVTPGEIASGRVVRG